MSNIFNLIIEYPITTLVIYLVISGSLLFSIAWFLGNAGKYDKEVFKKCDEAMENLFKNNQKENDHDRKAG